MVLYLFVLFIYFFAKFISINFIITLKPQQTPLVWYDYLTEYFSFSEAWDLKV